MFSSESALNVSAPQQLHKIIMEQKNEINDLKTRLARLEAIIDSLNHSRWNRKQCNRCLKRKTYIKERYEQNKEEISKHRREGYRCVPNVFLVCS